MQGLTTRTWFLILALAGLSLLWTGPLGPRDALACPNCKVLMTSDKNKNAQGAQDPNAANSARTGRQDHPQDLARMGRAYNLSIMLMMPLPFLLVAGLGGMLYWHMRKNNLIGHPPGQSPTNKSP